jgi:hypothetical protein
MEINREMEMREEREMGIGEGGMMRKHKMGMDIEIRNRDGYEEKDEDT